MKKIILSLIVATAINGVAIAVHAAPATMCADEATGQPAPCDPAPAKKASPAFLAGRVKSLARMRHCAVEWRAAKADEAVKAAGWPHYWSVCNSRLKTTTAQPVEHHND